MKKKEKFDATHAALLDKTEAAALELNSCQVLGFQSLHCVTFASSSEGFKVQSLPSCDTKRQENILRLVEMLSTVGGLPEVLNELNQSTFQWGGCGGAFQIGRLG